MKIKTHKYLEELAKAEKRGYEKGLRETEEIMWQNRRLEERERETEEFRREMRKRLCEHERKFTALCKELKISEPVSAEEYAERCENAAICDRNFPKVL